MDQKRGIHLPPPANSYSSHGVAEPNECFTKSLPLPLGSVKAQVGQLPPTCWRKCNICLWIEIPVFYKHKAKSEEPSLLRSQLRHCMTVQQREPYQTITPSLACLALGQAVIWQILGQAGACLCPEICSVPQNHPGLNPHPQEHLLLPEPPDSCKYAADTAPTSPHCRGFPVCTPALLAQEEGHYWSLSSRQPVS